MSTPLQLLSSYLAQIRCAGTPGPPQDLVVRGTARGFKTGPVHQGRTTAVAEVVPVSARTCWRGHIRLTTEPLPVRLRGATLLVRKPRAHKKILPGCAASLDHLRGNCRCSDLATHRTVYVYQRNRSVIPISRARVPSIERSAPTRISVMRPVPGTEMLLIGGLNVG